MSTHKIPKVILDYCKAQPNESTWSMIDQLLFLGMEAHKELQKNNPESKATKAKKLQKLLDLRYGRNGDSRKSLIPIPIPY